VLEQMPDQVRGDEAGAAGHQNALSHDQSSRSTR
jgi:hypothetical protein